ncbi:MAG: AarF/ABC1/UbiB kinase family protein [Alicyclobacillus sp.]|nr:AarF/ABC1/UbiB kinase family protein [Alicyclobacillus sp.]
MSPRVIARRVHIVRLAIRVYRAFRQIQRLQERGADDAALHRVYAAAGRDIRETASRLCGAIVKAGQFLSLREELFPAAFTRELQSLQDAVPPAPFAQVERVLERAYGRRFGQCFDTLDPVPIASGSLAQVHRGVDTQGRVVAVKVLRPGIERMVRADLQTLRWVARVASRVPAVRRRIDLVALHRSFDETLRLELDMRAEAEHMLRLQADLAQFSERLTLPAVYAAASKRRVLVMEYVSGVNIRDGDQLRAWGSDPAALRDALLAAYLKQVLVTGFVHLDPHPGNLLVLQDGRLALLDFGMAAAYGEPERMALRRLLQHAVLQDASGVAAALQDLGFVQPGCLDAVTEVVGHLLKDRPPAAVAMTQLRGLVQAGAVRVQARYMLLIRCLGMLKTSLTLLTPEETDWAGVVMEQALPFFRR